MLPDHMPRFHALTGVHEPSGIRQLTDGRFIVGEDEALRPRYGR
ncbi:MAG: hypothetical protein V5B35_01155 [Candidatus Accumulibacter necessarius]|jgi:hypothetical protein